MHLQHELEIQNKNRKIENKNTDAKNRYDENSKWGYIILVIALIVFVCAFAGHNRHQQMYNHNGQPDTYRNCQSPFIR